MFSPLKILVVTAIWILKGSSLPKIYLNNSLLTINESEKYIGIDYRLNFEDQIKLLTAKISRSLSVIYSTNFSLPSL